MTRVESRLNQLMNETSVYYPPDTRKHQARKTYADVGLEFVGFRTALCTHWTSKKDVSWEECVDYCADKRKKEGKSWNGCNYFYDSNMCVVRSDTQVAGGYDAMLYIFKQGK